MTIRRALAGWTDWDVAQHALGVCSCSSDPDYKGIFWSANPIGDALYQALEELARGRILERREEPDVQFRWAPEAPCT